MLTILFDKLNESRDRVARNADWNTKYAIRELTTDQLRALDYWFHCAQLATRELILRRETAEARTDELQKSPLVLKRRWTCSSCAHSYLEPRENIPLVCPQCGLPGTLECGTEFRRETPKGESLDELLKEF